MATPAPSLSSFMSAYLGRQREERDREHARQVMADQVKMFQDRLAFDQASQQEAARRWDIQQKQGVERDAVQDAATAFNLQASGMGVAAPPSIQAPPDTGFGEIGLESFGVKPLDLGGQRLVPTTPQYRANIAAQEQAELLRRRAQITSDQEWEDKQRAITAFQQLPMAQTPIGKQRVNRVVGAMISGVAPYSEDMNDLLSMSLDSGDPMAIRQVTDAIKAIQRPPATLYNPNIGLNADDQRAQTLANQIKAQVGASLRQRGVALTDQAIAEATAELYNEYRQSGRPSNPIFEAAVGMIVGTVPTSPRQDTGNSMIEELLKGAIQRQQTQKANAGK